MVKFDLISAVRHLLTPQEVLSPLIFDENKLMHENVRQKLLAVTDFIVQKTIASVPGLTFEDVCLTGSMSGYFYRNQSDIDMRIIVANKSCKALAKDRKHIDKFLATQINGLYNEGYRFTFRKHLIDTKMSTSNIDIISLYSIKNNTWLIEPVRDLNISESELLDYYAMRKKEVMEEYEKIKQKYHGPDLGRD